MSTSETSECSRFALFPHQRGACLDILAYLEGVVLNPFSFGLFQREPEGKPGTHGFIRETSVPWSPEEGKELENHPLLSRVPFSPWCEGRRNWGHEFERVCGLYKSRAAMVSFHPQLGDLDNDRIMQCGTWELCFGFPISFVRGRQPVFPVSG